MDLTPLERAVVDTLLSRDGPGYAELREQATHARVVTRETTGVGFYTTIEVDADAPPSPACVGNPVGQGHDFPDEVHAELDGLEHGAGFLLWLEGGRLETLEGFAYAERWPSEVRRFDVRLLPVSRS